MLVQPFNCIRNLKLGQNLENYTKAYLSMALTSQIGVIGDSSKRAWEDPHSLSSKLMILMSSAAVTSTSVFSSLIISPLVLPASEADPLKLSNEASGIGGTNWATLLLRPFLALGGMVVTWSDDATEPGVDAWDWYENKTSINPKQEWK